MCVCIIMIAIEVSIKPASSSRVITKRAMLNLTGTVPALDRVEDLSTYSKVIIICDNLIPSSYSMAVMIVGIIESYQYGNKLCKCMLHLCVQKMHLYAPKLCSCVNVCTLVCQN